ncbi:MAG: flagellar motor switch protein FliN [Chloroflexi bacterium]|nr:MAG: flagellar motor switch protein FliN [Chloroflexota bacterium]MBL1194811.1 flagellar motor switch protein FliN [Chloroflexota bacterium]NOH12102.1 flagellar motor switch protein FliN [Chloroflexota bacterium]
METNVDQIQEAQEVPQVQEELTPPSDEQAAAEPVEAPTPQPAPVPQPAPAATPDSQGVRMDGLMGVNLDVVVEIGRAQMSMGEILELQNGSVVELDRVAGDVVDVLINDKLMARGEVVIVDDKFGVRITDILSRDEPGRKHY